MSRNAFGPFNWAMNVPPMMLSNGRIDDDAHHVLLVLASRAKPDGTGAHPGLDWLARHSYRTPESAQRGLDACVAHGLIVQSGELNGTVVWRLCMEVTSHGRTVIDERQERARASNAERQRRWRERRAREAAEAEAVTPSNPVTRNAPDPRYVTVGKGVTRNGGEGRYVTGGSNAGNAPEGRYVTGSTSSQPQVTNGVTALGTTKGTTRGTTNARDEQFAAFYDAYPRHIGKAAARKAWDKAVSAGTDPAVILAGAQRFATERAGQDPKYTPYPASWLRAGRWEDEHLPAVVGLAGGYRPFQSTRDPEAWSDDPWS
ncbi:hypothetical protein SUDANB95_05480 [Actinosynnema sp. ALI-1.44]